MKILNSCLITLLILLSACRENSDHDNPQNQINISKLLDLDQEIKFLSEFNLEIEYFIPQATENSFFTLMGISYIGPNFAILHDKRTQDLLAFKRNGLFIGKLGSKGDAPMEYRSLPEVLVFRGIKEIHLIDKRGKKILRYSYDLEHIGSIKLDIIPKALAVYDEDYYICAYSDRDMKETGGNDLIIKNPQTFTNIKALLTGIAFKDENEEQYMLREYSLTRDNDTLLYVKQREDKVSIYRIFEDKISTLIEIDLKDSDESGVSENSLMQFKVINFANYLRIFLQRGQSRHNAYYNLATKEISNFKMINDLDKGLDFYPMGTCAGGGYYSDDLKIKYFINFWETVSKESPYKEIISKHPEKEKWLKESIPNAIEENPWIMILKPTEK